MGRHPCLPGSGQAPSLAIDNRVYLDGREVRGIIDERIDVRDADTGRAIDYGRIV
ncbi:hypothetical protein [Streptomyces phaeochromogenes]|uniref:hypothetical protein n=1 Tax=Streptomyces phaeochromogenes TaxID=1923 RepID=UPI0038678B18|nr:hypothetical protein OG277_06610 [Streptomyces phaeochromogenes]